MGRLHDQAISGPGLIRAWREMYDGRDRDEPGDRPGAIERFAESSDERLEQLAAQLAAGSYRPADLVEARIHEDGDERMLLIPPVRDRIVERSVLRTVTPWVDPVLGPPASPTGPASEPPTPSRPSPGAARKVSVGC